VVQAAARVMLPRRTGCIFNVASIMGPVGNSLYPNPVGKFSLTRFEMTLEIAAAIVRQREAVPPLRDLG
jgi:hypothetical protein